MTHGKYRNIVSNSKYLKIYTNPSAQHILRRLLKNGVSCNVANVLPIIVNYVDAFFNAINSVFWQDTKWKMLSSED